MTVRVAALGGLYMPYAKQQGKAQQYNTIIVRLRITHHLEIDKQLSYMFFCTHMGRDKQHIMVWEMIILRSQRRLQNLVHGHEGLRPKINHQIKVSHMMHNNEMMTLKSYLCFVQSSKCFQ